MTLFGTLQLRKYTRYTLKNTKDTRKNNIPCSLFKGEIEIKKTNKQAEVSLRGNSRI